MINENFVWLGSFICLLGGYTYIRDTLLGKIKPNRVSWGLWGLAVMVAFTAQVKQGVGIQSVPVFVVGFIPLLIFLSSFVNKKAYWKVTKFDILCGSLSIIGLILWAITKNPNLAILFSIFGDLSAGIPTIVKSFKFPETENWINFGTSFINISILFLTLKNFSFPFIAYPIYLLCYDLTAFTLNRFKIGKYIYSPTKANSND